jgi:hypothetical protein
MRGCGLDPTDSGQDPMAEHGNEPSASIKYEEFLAQMNYWHPLKKKFLFYEIISLQSEIFLHLTR